MDSVSKTLYIPLYGKAFVSKMGILLCDPKAEEIWQKEGFPIHGKAASKWLAYSMAMRAAVFDEWTATQLKADPKAVVLHIGCGLDSRYHRVGMENNHWYDIDFPEVIRERRKYDTDRPFYHMIGADIRKEDWKRFIPLGGSAIAVMEGISMYLKPEELIQLMIQFKSHFSAVTLLMDCYSTFAAKASKYKNPINVVGVTDVYGLDDPKTLGEKTGFIFLREHSPMPLRMIGQLTAGERIVFSNLYAGKISRSLYRLYEFKA